MIMEDKVRKRFCFAYNKFEIKFGLSIPQTQAFFIEYAYEPANPVEGTIVYDTGINARKIYIEGEWKIL